jgi:hypothetical protein
MARTVSIIAIPGRNSDLMGMLKKGRNSQLNGKNADKIK